MYCYCVVFGDALCCNVSSQHGYLRRYPFVVPDWVWCPPSTRRKVPVMSKLKQGGSHSVVPSLKGLTVVIKDETGEIPWGRMFGVQKWVSALGKPHWCLQSSCSCFIPGFIIWTHGSLDYVGGLLWTYWMAINTGFLS